MVEELDPSLVAAHEQARAQASLHLPEHVTVLWVHDQDTLAKAHQVRPPPPRGIYTSIEYRSPRSHPRTHHPLLLAHSM